MTGMFKQPKIKVPAPTPVATIDDARQNQEASDRLRRRRGRAAMTLTGALGDRSTALTATRSLLGG